jgi:hypothetical protein
MEDHLLEFYRKSDGKTKKKILGCLFAEKLVLEKGKLEEKTEDRSRKSESTTKTSKTARPQDIRASVSLRARVRKQNESVRSS